MYSELFKKFKRILITGGSGFIGGNLIYKLLKTTSCEIFNIDKMGYASDETLIRRFIGSGNENRYTLKQIDLTNANALDKAIKEIKPNLVMHLAAESHVDRSIDGPKIFMESNIIGTFNLLQSSLNYYKTLSSSEKEDFLFHHISTDEVFGSLGPIGSFNEKTPYDPRSPYSASKASSDHLVRAWNETYSLPTIITNCSNNFGPYQYPEKLLPVTILKLFNLEPVPIYGDGQNVRDWLFVDDHVNALMLAAAKGSISETYCIGGHGEMTNKQLVYEVCKIMDQIRPKNFPHRNLIEYVTDRPGHDKRYSIDPTKIKNELGWRVEKSFKENLNYTVNWYLENLEWCDQIMKKQKIERKGTF